MDQVQTLNQTLAIPFIITGLIIFLVISLKLLLFPRLTSPSNNNEPRRNGEVKVVISGAMASGKTRLWSRLIYGTDHIETVTSMVENKITLDSQKLLDFDGHNAKQNHSEVCSSVCLLDTPGHPRLCCRSLARNFPDANGVIFVVDNQSALSGKALRDTSAALELVLSLLHILHYQKPHSPLPKLLIHITNNSNQSNNLNLSSQSQNSLIEKIKNTLKKEMNRRKQQVNSTTDNHDYNRSFKSTKTSSTRLESLEAIQTSPEFTSFFSVDVIMDRFKTFIRSINPMNPGDPSNSINELPEEEIEVIKLLEDLQEEEGDLTDSKGQLLEDDPFDRFIKISGHPIAWSVSGTTHHHHHHLDHLGFLKNWLRHL